MIPNFHKKGLIISSTTEIVMPLITTSKTLNAEKQYMCAYKYINIYINVYVYAIYEQIN